MNPDACFRLVSHARALIGVSLGDLADQMGVPVPVGNAHAKGWSGQLVERELGASDGGHGVDFASLGIELKTVPTDPSLVPLESTWVCHVDPAKVAAESWETSYTRQKLSRVLFVALEVRDRRAPVGDRRVRAVHLWSPDPEQERDLRADFELFARIYFRTGRSAEITGHLGTVLQVRPKGRNAGDKRAGFGPEGQPTQFGRCGFYLRPSFVGRILANSV